MNEHTKQPNPAADSFRSLPTSMVVGALATNCWLYPLIEPGPHEQEQPCAVIDPDADPDMIIARMKRFRLYHRYVLLTHGHFDHVAALPGLVSHFSHEGRALEIAIHHADASSLGPDCPGFWGSAGSFPVWFYYGISGDSPAGRRPGTAGGAAFFLPPRFRQPRLPLGSPKRPAFQPGHSEQRRSKQRFYPGLCGPGLAAWGVCPGCGEAPYAGRWGTGPLGRRH